MLKTGGPNGFLGRKIHTESELHIALADALGM